MKKSHVSIISVLVLCLAAIAAQAQIDWDELQVLIQDGKPREAVELAASFREEASKTGDQAQWTRALVEEVRLNMALGAYETAAEHLLVQPWPEDRHGRDVLGLFQAKAMLDYLARYSWDIRQREGRDLPDSTDVATWSVDQISEEIHQTLAGVWAGRQDWDNQGLEDWSLYLRQNNYPARIRGTLRDAVTYLWADYLANTSLWTPVQSEKVHQLDLEQLMDGRRDLTALDRVTDPDTHPLERVSLILADLHQWHLQAGRVEAAHQAQLELLDHLQRNFHKSQDQVRIRQKLETLQADLDPGLPWWSYGQWRLASFMRDEGQPDSLVRAHLAAVRGQRRHPDSVGGKLCARVVAEIEMPDLEAQVMAQDAAGKRSIQLQHRNLDRVYLRAWRFDWEKPDPEYRRLLDEPNAKEIRAWMKSGEFDLAWSVDLPAVEDYATHQTYTGLPACDPGPYVVVASTREDFKSAGNQFVAMNILVSDLVLEAENVEDHWEVLARSGKTGQFLPGVDLEILSQPRGRNGYDPFADMTTDKRGVAEVYPDDRRVVVFGRRGADVALVENLYPWRSRALPSHRQCVLYTDRSVYRPGQVVYWKAVLYDQDNESLEHRVSPETPLTVYLKDPNGQELVSAEVVTNGFGSASGQFTLPTGGLLGRWVLEVPRIGRQNIQVEQYKRPTFEAAFDKPEDQPRLNHPVQLQGRATYYFGQPVTDGQVTWTVTRAPVFQRWNPRWAGAGPATRILAHGTGNLASDGTFAVAFTPEADRDLQDDAGISYSFRVEAQVTGSGGETRSASRNIRLGFVGVAARLEIEEEFLLAGTPGLVTAQRTNLDGQPLAGTGAWRLVALEQPEAVLLPADQPVPGPPLLSVTPGDTLAPRWSRGNSGAGLAALWPDGEEVASGEASHQDDGQAEIKLPDLAAGAYRIHYQTADDQGRVVTASREILVAGRQRTPLALPLVILAENPIVRVGGTARILVHSGLADQHLRLQMVRDRQVLRDEILVSGSMGELLEIPVTEDLRGGFQIKVSGLRDFQTLEGDVFISVPWDNKELTVEYLSFRDRVTPGSTETIKLRVTGPDSLAVAVGTVEVLAYMYDRSLDIFATHRPFDPRGLYSQRRAYQRRYWSVGRGRAFGIGGFNPRERLPEVPQLWSDRPLLYTVPRDADHLVSLGSAISEHAVPSVASKQFTLDSVEDSLSKQAGVVARDGELHVRGGRSGEESFSMDGVVQPGGSEPLEPPVQLRENFNPTAFFTPHVELDEDGTATIEYQVPDAVTDWTVWAHALTRDMRGGSASRNTSSLKDLLVRPYLPRFLREGDQAVLKVVVDNAGDAPLDGRVSLKLTDPETGADLAGAFGFENPRDLERPFSVPAGQGADLSFALSAPRGLTQVAVQVIARAGNISDGERHLLPILPGRMQLIESRFVTLDGKTSREMSFPLMSAGSDQTLINEQLTVTVDAQLFQGVLAALPYLRDYPYECTEQTLNRFVSTAMVAGVFTDHPAVKAMADGLKDRDTRLPVWEQDDPNRKLRLEETPWLVTARGGGDDPENLINMLDAATVQQQRTAALERLKKSQDAQGGFAWWPGGRPSVYMTLYVLQGLTRAHEFGAEMPLDVVVPAWRYLHRECLGYAVDSLPENEESWRHLTFLNYLLSGLEGQTLKNTGFTDDDRRLMLDHSFKHWREHSRLLKGQLALTLARADRAADAKLVMDSALDGLITDPDLGAWWAPEDHAWLWFQDTIEGHAFVLRALTELDPDDARRAGLVTWLFLNRQLGHWKSTRATAEVLYALVHYLENEGTLAVPEHITVTMGRKVHQLDFDPEVYTGQDNHIVVRGDDIDPEQMATVTVAKTTKGLAFASATWIFSTENAPAGADGDLLSVTRKYFRRVQDGERWILQPLHSGDTLAVGDQVEVQLDITARSAAEYVHLRDPRGAGFEPEDLTSGYRWGGGLSRYLEVRDSGTNFFFDRLPAGAYTLKYRLRVAMAGTFKVGPAQLQSMYAPEFAAHSAGAEFSIAP